MSTPADHRSVLTAILSRAAFVESARQQAAKRGDAIAEHALQRELADLRAAYLQAQADGRPTNSGGRPP
jgi:hypothetical protein